MALLPTTELEAINIMLGTIGQSPVSSLPSATNSTSLVDAVVAEQVLAEISRKVQKEGWNFNTNIDYAIAPDVNGFITPPTNTLQIKVTKDYEQYNVTQRGTKMWDRENNTFVFTKTIKFDVVLFLDFTDMNEAARSYITVRAARTFQDRIFGSDTLHAYSKEDEDRERADMERADHADGNYSIFDDPATAQAVSRR